MKLNSSPGIDALKFLKADHKEVSSMFEKFKNGRLSKDAKVKLAAQICNALKIHAQIEEEIFYPAAREFLKKRELSLINEAEVEHESIKELVMSIENAQKSALFEAQVHVLGEWVKHHVKEEENEIFPDLKNSKIDLNVLGAQLAERKLQLQSGLIEQTGAWIKSKISGFVGSKKEEKNSKTQNKRVLTHNIEDRQSDKEFYKEEEEL